MPPLRRNMIEGNLLVDMMIRYIEQNGIKPLMKLVLLAIENSKED